MPDSSVLSKQMKVISMTTIQLENDVKFSSVKQHRGMIAKRNPSRIGLRGGEGERKCPSGAPPAVPGCGHDPLIARLTPAPCRPAPREGRLRNAKANARFRGVGVRLGSGRGQRQGGTWVLLLRCGSWEYRLAGRVAE